MANDHLPPPPGDDDLVPDIDDLDAEIAAQAAAEAEQYPPKEEPAQPAPPEITFADVDDVVRNNLEEIGDARLVVKRWRNQLLFDNTTGEAFRFNCQRWIKDTNRCHQPRVAQLAEPFKARAADLHAQIEAKLAECPAGGCQRAPKCLKCEEADRIRGFKKAHETRAKNLCKLPHINKVWTLATAGEDSLGISGDEWERHPSLLVCKNCVVDLETGRSYQGRPDWYLYKASPVEYHGLNVDAEFWDDLLWKVSCKDQDWIDYLGLVVGYSATGLSNYKDFYCAYGPLADNAKSTVYGAIRSALGDYSETLPVELLLDGGRVKASSGPQPDIMRLRHLRMAVFDEAEQNQHFAMSAIKRYSGGEDMISARGMYGKEQVTFPSTAKLHLHTNFIPKARGNDEGFYNRLRVIPFEACFVLPGRTPPTGANPEHTYQAQPGVVKRELERCRPGILSWIVRNAVKVHKLIAEGKGLPLPDRVREAVRDYRNEQDMTGRFLRECCVVGEGATQMKDLYAAYKKWCLEEMQYTEKMVPTMKTFGIDLKTRLKRVPPKNITVYAVTVAPCWLPSDEERSGELF